MRILLCLLLMTTLTGCLRNISLDGLASTGGATVGATLGGLVSPEAALITGVAAGIAVDAATVAPTADPESFKGEDGELSFTELLAYMWYNFTSHLITIGILVGIFWILTGYLGARVKRPEEKKAEQQIMMLVDKIGKMKE